MNFNNQPKNNPKVQFVSPNQPPQNKKKQTYINPTPRVLTPATVKLHKSATTAAPTPSAPPVVVTGVVTAVSQKLAELDQDNQQVVTIVGKVNKKNGISTWWKLLIGIVLVLVLVAGALAIPQVRDTLSNSGPLTLTEQTYVNDVAQLNELAGNSISSGYSCLLSSINCGVDQGFKNVYVQLGSVKDKFQALKIPSSRFDYVHGILVSAYSSLGASSNFAFESITQKRTTNNLTEMLTRLDSGRKLLEQAKAELKSTVQSYTKK